MATATVQPIAGVSANREADIEAIYPSIAGSALGGLIGSIMDGVAGVPFLPLRLVISILVGALLLPLALLAYILTKLFGSYYVLTNRSIQQRNIIGNALSQQIALTDFEEIEIASSGSGGYKFHRTGDLNLQNAKGTTLMTLTAISYPERLSQIIFDAREARIQSDESLSIIQNRA
ncbi:hypothetical protein [Thalassoglobus polymorphus]|uniref:DUF304 domain-containing protein n=1 Tax=Thalassoglobus polymorphus TaxID=2527994 RepID=A0A517QV43_9PLAN|nr:hypothetical protein [Thalassoglobus polymorphus]QDT35506.1 hypothetical protein Mal48_47830 [Thalassoglobus polymorphus]